MAVRRADARTETSVRGEIYSDFLTDFSKNPVTGELARVTNDEAIKQSIRNLVRTGLGERPFESGRIGSKVHNLLFEPPDPITADLIAESVKEVLRAYEPRANILDVSSRYSERDDSYTLSVLFVGLNIAAPLTVDVSLKRVR